MNKYYTINDNFYLYFTPKIKTLTPRYVYKYVQHKLKIIYIK